MDIQLNLSTYPTYIAKILLYLTIVACWVHLLFFPMHMSAMPEHKLFNLTYLIGWMIMVIAMMGGFLSSSYTYIGNTTTSLRTNIASIILYTFMWLLAWVAVGEIFSFIPSLKNMHNRLLILGSVLIVAGLWNITCWKQRALHSCHQEQTLQTLSAPWYLNAISHGIKHGWSCVQTCWLMMVVMVIVPAHSISMIILTLIGVIEQITKHPRRTSHIIAAVFIFLGVSVIIVAIYREGIPFVH